LKYFRYEVNIWSIEEQVESKVAGITKIKNIDLEDDKFNGFIDMKLEIIKKLIDEI